MKCKLLFLFALVFSYLSVLGQETIISGKIIDEKGVTIPFAAVTLHSEENDSLVLTSVMSSDEGLFSIKIPARDKAYLKVRHLVFETFSQIVDLRRNTDLNIILSEKEHWLNGVTIMDKPRYRVKEDGNMVINVDKVPGSETDNTYEVLRKLPGVIISQQGIKLNGMNIEIKVDGRDMPYMDVMTLLRSLPANSLDQIELISIKGAEYDATDSGIINLKTKRQLLEGYFGSLNGSLMKDFDKMALGSGNGFVTIKKRKITFSTTLSTEYTDARVTGENKTYFSDEDKSILTDMYQRDKEWKFSNNSNFIWDINKSQSLFINWFLGKWSVDRKYTKDQINQIGNESVYNSADIDVPRYVVSGNVEYRFGELLKLYYGYVYTKMDKDENYESIYSDGRDIPFFHGDDNKESQHILKADFLKKFIDNRLTLKAGGKATLAKQENNSYYIAGQEIPYSNLHYSADENILSFYLTFFYRFSDKLHGNLGVRGEHTRYKIDDFTGEAASSPNYTDLFPDVQFFYRFTPEYNLSVQLRSSTTRPNYKSMLPGKRYEDEYNYNTGNPYLNPVKIYSVSLRNSFWNKWNVIIGYNRRNDEISQVKLDKGEGITETTMMNAVDINNFNLSSSLYLSLFDKLTCNLNYNWTIGKYINPKYGFTIPDNNRFNNMQMSGFFYYQINERTGVNASVHYMAVSENLQKKDDTYASLNLGVNMSFLKNKELSVAVNFNDVFGTVKRSYKQRYDNNLLTSKIDFPSQFVGLSLSYRFKGGKRFDKKESEMNDIQRFSR